MSILTLQRRLMEAGRIRIGQKDPERGYPTKLESFRLTSRDRQKIDQAADLWGGTVEPWDSPSGKQFQVVTDTDVVDVIVPPSEMAFSQWYETWSAGGCQRRCDGVTEQLTEGPCLCDPDGRECDIHTRLSVMLRDLPGLGVWRVDTSGYYAAVELGGSVQVIAAAAGRGAMLPARLRLEQRSVKRPGKDGKPQTLRFAVPVLDVDISPGQLMEATSVPSIDVSTMAEAEPKLLDPVPSNVLESPVGSVAEQASTFPERKPRSNAAQPIPETGVEPRTVKEVEKYVDAPIREEIGDETPTQQPAEDAWGELQALLGPDVDSSRTVKELEADLRRVYELMEALGMWPADSLHKALDKHADADHVGDMNKTEGRDGKSSMGLVPFMELSWREARKAVKKYEEPFE